MPGYPETQSRHGRISFLLAASELAALVLLCKDSNARGYAGFPLLLDRHRMVASLLNTLNDLGGGTAEIIVNALATSQLPKAGTVFVRAASVLHR